MTDLMDRVWEAFWGDETTNTAAALERVVAVVRAERQAEIDRMREALEVISRLAGNLPDDILCSPTGANDARYRGGLVCTARDIARATLQEKRT